MSFDLAVFAAGSGVADAELFAERCEFLRQLLEKANESVNLTRITGFDDFNIKHAADSLMIARAFPALTGQELTVADIGCGAGVSGHYVLGVCIVEDKFKSLGKLVRLKRIEIGVVDILEQH